MLFRMNFLNNLAVGVQNLSRDTCSDIDSVVCNLVLHESTDSEDTSPVVKTQT